ncbi:MAG: DUF1329 domain-containing protein [Halieaceae bacterium]|nr:DUF1329 domain-containing protein [Halieaceae bacterium]
MRKFLFPWLVASSLAADGALAAVSADLAAELGKSLTPTGAEMAGNADGSIPPWNPQGTPIPTNFVPGTTDYVDPYADENPLYTITGKNWRDYADNLTAGTQAMFEKYGADGWEMRVYPSHRGAVRPDWYYANTARNATAARLVEDGQKIVGNYPGIPFPIPQSGLEAIWNHMVRYGIDSSQHYDTYYVDASGQAILATSAYSTSVFPMFKQPDEEVGDKVWNMLRINYSAPARRAGEILLVHEPGADYTQGKGRKAWQYLVGQRRVRLAPAVSFDTPNPGVAGTSTYDDAFIYNGSPERFNWRLLGKREIIIPAACYRFIFQSRLEETLGPKFLKPEFIRWEKHRLWVVESTLKPGQRHLYSRRTFYLDEDTWGAVAGEMYDGRGQLWRLQYLYGANLYDRQAGYGSAYGAYDLLQNIYNLNGKLIPGRFRIGVEQPEMYFTPKGMARSGVR